MSSNNNPGSLSEDAQDPYKPQSFFSGAGIRHGEGEKLGQQQDQRRFAGWNTKKKAESSQRTGIKPLENAEQPTSGKYSYTHDDLIDPDE